MSIPEELWMLSKDFLDSDHRWRNETDKIRLISLIKKGVTSGRSTQISECGDKTLFMWSF
ncbi:hypothetical protein ABK736_13275 [Klebsiella aerogenes]|nr:hypothetical protein [Klebsiella aerogenes]MDX7185757.1 hypothetical protein [Klebsiella aerogenes]